MEEKRLKRFTQDLIGKRFNMLTVIDRVNVNGKPMCKCVCDCGNVVNIRMTHLNEGQISCGCYANKMLGDRKRKHGHRSSRLYSVWRSMKARCGNPNHKSYNNYGGRGIKVCDEWVSDFGLFYEWAMKNGYDECADFSECTIDRINTNGNYEPDNCRFTTMKKQCNNRRNTVFISFNDEIHSISEWAEITGIKYSTLYYRLKHGCSLEDVFSTLTNDEYRLVEG